jgi:hypothetical protein
MMEEPNCSVHTVEAVRAWVHGDPDTSFEVAVNWLQWATEEQGLEALAAAGELLRDAYAFAAVLIRTMTSENEEMVEQLMDAYAMQAMEGAV